MRKRGKWLWTGGSGASLLCFGLCGAIESGFLKHEGAPWYMWVIAGTFSLCGVVLGVVLLIKAGFLEQDR
ncbi:MAG: hypothetical protein AAF717_01965 [Bacteroidota bacterium]